MTRPGLFEGILVALAISLVTAVLFTVMSSFFPTRWLLHAVIMGVSFTYIVYLLFRSKEKVGKPSVMLFWLLASLATWLFSPSILISLMVHVSLIWLVRALYYYSSMFMALLDLGLLLLAVVISSWTLFHTKSVFLSVWSFLLLQSLYVLVPENIQSFGRKQTNKASASDITNDRFEEAYQSAQLAIRQLTVK